MSRIIILDSGAEKRLPAEYVEVEYLQSSGTQWINTGVIGSSNTCVKLAFQGVNSDYDIIFGTGDADDSDSNYFFKNPVNGTSKDGFYVAASYNYAPTASDYNKHTVIYNDNGVYKHDNNIITTTHTTPSWHTNIALFGSLNSSGQIIRPTKSRIYYCKISDSTGDIRDLVPCYLKTGSVPGMYDLVNDVFYENAGTGNFTLGPDVTAIYYETIERSVIYQPGLLDRTVRFKVDNQDYQVVSVKTGQAIGYPIGKPYWADASGNRISFPYTPTADIVLYYDSKLPSIYQEVQYLTYDGDSYINTGINPTDTTNYEVSFSLSEKVNAGYVVLGARQTAGQNSLTFWCYILADNGMRVDINNSIRSIGTTPELNIKYTMKKAGDDYYLDDAHVATVASGVFTCTYPITLGAVNTAGTTGFYHKGNIYTCTFYNDNDPIGNFVPCYKKSDPSQVGMYDLITNTFFTNSGTGTLTPGPDVN